MKIKLLFLSLLIGQLYANDSSMSNARARRRSAIAQKNTTPSHATSSRVPVNSTPGRRAEGFTNNPRLNWRHPYMNQ